MIITHAGWAEHEWLCDACDEVHYFAALIRDDGQQLAGMRRLADGSYRAWTRHGKIETAIMDIDGLKGFVEAVLER